MIEMASRDIIPAVNEYVATVADGMAAKLAAAEIAMAEGVNIVLASGEDPNIVLDICSGRARGTLFRAEEINK